jgi:hypothetical protein
VKKTKMTWVSDTVYFNYKYITQPTITLTDAVIKALQDLTSAIKGERHVKANSQFNAIMKLQEVFSPGHQLVPECYTPERSPTDKPTPRMEEKQQVPRVNEAPEAPIVHFYESAPQMVVYNANPRVPLNQPRVV